MNLISAYLTRQVNGGGGGKEEFTRDFLDRLKNAVLLGDLDGFVETMHVIITPEGQLNRETTQQGIPPEYIYNPYTTERYVEGWYTETGGIRCYYKGASWVANGANGVCACLYKWDKFIDGYGDIGLNMITNPNYHGRPTTALTWNTETWTQSSWGIDVTHYLTTTLCTIPIFSSYEFAQMYSSRVATYCNSKSDDDFNEIKSIMENYLYDYDYELG